MPSASTSARSARRGVTRSASSASPGSASHPEAIARVSAPVGLDIGSRTAAEIGISIAAELVRARAHAVRERATR